MMNFLKKDVAKPTNQIVVTLTVEEKDRYDVLLEKIESAYSAYEIMIYYKQAKKIIEKARQRENKMQAG